MITELSGILISILSMGTVGSVGGAIWYRKHNNRMNLLQERLSSMEVEKAAIESKSQTWDLYEDQLNVANNRIKELLEINREKEQRLIEKDRLYSERISEVEERFNKQTTFLRGIQKELNLAYDTINKLTSEKSQMQRLIDHLKQWLCRRPWCECKRREPEQIIKQKKYLPLDDDSLEKQIVKIESEEEIIKV